MEDFIGILLCFLALPALIFFVFLLIRLSALGTLEKKVERLTKEMDASREAYGRLTQQLAKLTSLPAPTAPIQPTQPIQDSGIITAQQPVTQHELRVEVPSPAAAPVPIEAPVAPMATDVAPTAMPVVETERASVVAAAPPAQVPPVAPLPKAPPIPPKPAAPVIDINWEKWLGIRGAAAGGGIIFAIALIMLAKFSIEAGWISPAVRMAVAAAMAIGALVGSEVIRKRYASTANALAGGGIVGMYAVAYAARSVYSLIPSEVAFVIMIMTTVVCALIALKHDTLFTAMMGLIGGFATPLLLSTGENKPYAFFGYILLLDAGFVTVALKKKWHLLTGAALIGTVIMQAGWITGRMESGQAILALGILLVFAAFFVFVGVRARSSGASREWLITQGAAIVLPLCIGMYLASRTDIDMAPLFFGGMVLILSIGALVVSRTSKSAAISLSAATLSGIVVAIRMLVTIDNTHQPSLEWIGIMLALTLAFHIGLELKRSAENSAAAGIVSAMTWLGLTLCLAFDGQHHAPFLIGIAALFVITVRHAVIQKSLPIGMLAALGAAASWAFAVVLTDDPTPHTWILFTGLIACAAMLVMSLINRNRESGRLLAHTAATLSLAMMGALLVIDTSNLPGFVTAFLVLALSAATLTAFDGWLAGVFVVALLFALEMMDSSHGYEHRTEFFAGWMVIFGLWRFLAGKALSESKLALVLSIASPAVYFLELYSVGKPWAHPGFLPVVLAAFSIAMLLMSQTKFFKEQFHQTALAGYGGVALSFLALAIPLELERHWIWVGWSVMGLALIFWWQRVNHVGLKYFGAALLGLAIAGLVFSPIGSTTFRSTAREMPIFNWIFYTYAAAIIASILSSRILNSLELPRALPFEKSVYLAKTPVIAVALYASALLLGFVWLNVAITDFFSGGAALGYHRDASRDLATSIGWGVYALLLLVLGVIQTAKPLRWASLILLMITLLKVTFYDMGNLTGLYRVGSLLGLAISLIVVSLLYQRFVFRKDEPTIPEVTQ